MPSKKKSDNDEGFAGWLRRPLPQYLAVPAKGMTIANPYQTTEDEINAAYRVSTKFGRKPSFRSKKERFYQQGIMVADEAGAEEGDVEYVKDDDAGSTAVNKYADAADVKSLPKKLSDKFSAVIRSAGRVLTPAELSDFEAKVLADYKANLFGKEIKDEDTEADEFETRIAAILATPPAVVTPPVIPGRPSRPRFFPKQMSQSPLFVLKVNAIQSKAKLSASDKKTFQAGAELDYRTNVAGKPLDYRTDSAGKMLSPSKMLDDFESRITALLPTPSPAGPQPGGPQPALPTPTPAGPQPGGPQPALPTPTPAGPQPGGPQPVPPGGPQPVPPGGPQPVPPGGPQPAPRTYPAVPLRAAAWSEPASFVSAVKQLQQTFSTVPERAILNAGFAEYTKTFAGKPIVDETKDVQDFTDAISKQIKASLPDTYDDYKTVNDYPDHLKNVYNKVLSSAQNANPFFSEAQFEAGALNILQAEFPKGQVINKPVDGAKAKRELNKLMQTIINNTMLSTPPASPQTPVPKPRSKTPVPKASTPPASPQTPVPKPRSKTPVPKPRPKTPVPKASTPPASPKTPVPKPSTPPASPKSPKGPTPIGTPVPKPLSPIKPASKFDIDNIGVTVPPQNRLEDSVIENTLNNFADRKKLQRHLADIKGRALPRAQEKFDEAKADHKQLLYDFKAAEADPNTSVETLQNLFDSLQESVNQMAELETEVKNEERILAIGARLQQQQPTTPLKPTVSPKLIPPSEAKKKLAEIREKSVAELQDGRAKLEQKIKVAAATLEQLGEESKDLHLEKSTASEDRKEEIRQRLVDIPVLFANQRNLYDYYIEGLAVYNDELKKREIIKKILTPRTNRRMKAAEDKLSLLQKNYLEAKKLVAAAERKGYSDDYIARLRADADRIYDRAAIFVSSYALKPQPQMFAKGKRPPAAVTKKRKLPSVAAAAQAIPPKAKRSKKNSGSSQGIYFLTN
jgi:hypothetical protein